ncbi:MAG: stage V sporulation protein D, partial [Peptococcaceae bacterium]|nr:stage V sporulation protein D [Peptococcaceae bacterium]
DSSVWNNFAVNGLYEPGSTFKILTTAMALEERATTADEGFYCPGYQYIGKMRMRCHKAAGHGLESFTQGVANSCNPVFVTVSDRVGMGKFYDYLDAFGMTRTTGITLPGETGSLIVPEKSAVPYDLAAMAIGQSNAFTPLQMITAISAVANDGYLMQPYIVEKIVSQDGKTVTETQPKVIRQVISTDTSREASAILETVVSSGTGKPGAIEGYRIAGKTGTAEKVAETGGYSNERVVSFVGYAPADDPQIACLVIVDEPTDAHGGSTAGPVFRQIMEDTLRYLEIPKTVTVTESTGVEEVIVPKLDGMHPVDAIEAIKQAGLTPIVETQGDTLLTYVPADGTKVQKTGNIYLYCADADSTTRIMPSLYGRTIKEVDRILSGMGLVATMNGSGLSTSQSILEGTPVETGTALIVEFHTAEEIEEIRRQEELIRQQEEAMKENQVNESDENSGGEIETENAV